MKVSGSKTTASVPSRPRCQVGAQAPDDLSVGGERETVGGDRRSGDVAAEAFEALALVGADLDPGVQGEAVQVAAEQARDEARAALARPAQADDGSAAAGPEGPVSRGALVNSLCVLAPDGTVRSDSPAGKPGSESEGF